MHLVRSLQIYGPAYVAMVAYSASKPRSKIYLDRPPQSTLSWWALRRSTVLLLDCRHMCSRLCDRLVSILLKHLQSIHHVSRFACCALSTPIQATLDTRGPHVQICVQSRDSRTLQPIQPLPLTALANRSARTLPPPHDTDAWFAAVRQVLIPLNEPQATGPTPFLQTPVGLWGLVSRTIVSEPLLKAFLHLGAVAAVKFCKTVSTCQRPPSYVKPDRAVGGALPATCTADAIDPTPAT